ncbi:phage tail length tape measure family protein [Sphingomonas sp. PAMC 26621]|uniref:phage tail length tape measure family protein n=1 Tax=Sphingomonas sp. PAMC 26621 TaxID=1112213 RepID=UPI000288B851|nr:phage tail length tape measure family protein [Sphingomonas sp. PAMC 26621]
MAQTDIIARLQLNAQQFSSESGKAAAEITGRMTRAANDIRQPFVSAFAEVQKSAQTAITMPRTAAGSLDLSSEIAQLSQAAHQADQHAIALRELSQAQLSASSSGRVGTEALRLEADASAVASIAAEREASAHRDRIVVLQEVQRELNQTTSATTALTHTSDATRGYADAGRQVVVSAGAQRAGMQQLGFQLNDVATSFQGGISPMTIFAQQGSQVIQAIGLMAGESKGLIGFLGGPWGAVLTAATVVTAPFVLKLFEGSDGGEKLAKSLADAATAADSFGNAESVIGKVIDLATGKLKTHNEVLIQTIKLQAQAGILKAQEDQKSAATALKGSSTIGTGETLVDFGKALLSSNTMTGPVESLMGSVGKRINQLGPLTRDLNAYKTAAESYAAVLNDPKASPAAVTAANNAFNASLDQTMTKIGASAGSAGRDVMEVKKQVLALGTALNDQNAMKQALGVVNGGPVPDDLKPYKADDKPKTPKKPKVAPDQNREAESAAEAIARINAEWDKQPRLVDKASLETLKLDNMIKDLTRRKPPGFDKLIADAQAAKGHIRDGLDRPFQDFIQHQQEGVAVQRLQLQGRDAEADALQAAIRLQEQQGPLDAEHLAALLRGAQQQEAITRQIEDQRRVIGVYENSLGDVRRTFDDFIGDLQDGRVADGVKGLFGGIVNDFKSLQRNLISNQLFGGIDRDIESYIRKMTGRQTPAEILESQATDAAKVLRIGANDNVSALDELTRAFRSASASFASGAANDNGGIAPELLDKLMKGNGVTGPTGSLNDLLSRGNGVSGPGPDGAADIVVTGKIDRSAEKLLTASGVFGIGFDRFVKNLDGLGIKLPQTLTAGLKKTLPDVLKGASIGGLSGSVFSSITGGKSDPLASGIGGALGQVAGKALGKTIGDGASGLLKSLGGAAGPIGAVLGGVLGSVVGGLFNSPKWSTSSVSLNGTGTVTGNKGSGTSGEAIAAATGVASSVASGINSIAEQLGATIKSLPALTLGTFDSKYRVATTATTKSLNYNNFSDSTLKDFGSDQQAAIEYAVRYSISNAVINGISKASQTILASGQDLQSAITKALLIEAVPRDLKAALDPVGAAIDALNLKWQKTVNALKEGGATTEQMAQAQQLYTLQLDKVKNSTDSASQSLKDFMTSLKVGSGSAYSLRDQEATARAQLQPFLDQINSGQAVDQTKYQDAAKSFLDVERQLLGSTDGYFKALDEIQAATNKAISSIDNAVPITAAVASPFAEATAKAAADTAAGVNTGNQMTEDTNGLLAQIATLMQQVADNTGGGSGGFISAPRAFLK